MTTRGKGVRAILAALGANVGIAVAKVIAWLATGSAAMLAEAIHSFADSGNEVLLLLGSSRARRAPDVNHQFGHGRIRFVFGFMVAIVLFLAGGLFAIHEAIEKLEHPEPVRNAGWAIGVVLIAMVLEGLSLRTGLRASRSARKGHSLLAYVHRTRQPELPVVLLEDTAALAGLVMALLGVSASLVTGNPLWDALGSLGIGVLLVVVAIFLGIEMASMLVGEGALPAEQVRIRAAIERVTSIERVIHLRTLMVGPEDLLVGVKIAVATDATGAEIAAAIDAAEAEVRRAVPEATYIYMEPDVDRYRQA